MSRPLLRLLGGDDSAAAAASAPAKSTTLSTIMVLGFYATAVVVVTVIAYRLGFVLRFCNRVLHFMCPGLNRALRKEVLVSLPTFTFSPESAVAGGSGVLSSECVICLDDYVVGDEVRLLPQCGHSFHAVCVDQWFHTRSSCPSCRQVPLPPTA